MWRFRGVKSPKTVTDSVFGNINEKGDLTEKVI